MKFVMFYHTLVSDWNHGNAHFLRGIASELVARGHDVTVFEPEDCWSRTNLLAEHGEKPIRKFRAVYPMLSGRTYRQESLDLNRELDGTDVVIVHEWNKHELVRRIGEHHAANPDYALLFHDTHHRMVTAPEEMSAYDLQHYDGVLAYGDILRRLYEQSGRVKRAWTWHEAADTRVFQPTLEAKRERDLVWIGNWGDNERSAELHEFLIEPVARLKLRARVYGVRYPEDAKVALAKAGIEYAGWLPNFEAPRVFSEFKVTVHVPRRPYVKALPGIPTIRPFEALACGIPMVSAPWDDVEGLFTPGKDFLVARDGREMTEHLRMLTTEPGRAIEITQHGLETIKRRHTCRRRVDELLGIVAEVEDERRAGTARPALAPSNL
jgi:spore maturation protein CgeB